MALPMASSGFQAKLAHKAEVTLLRLGETRRYEIRGYLFVALAMRF